MKMLLAANFIIQMNILISAIIVYYTHVCRAMAYPIGWPQGTVPGEHRRQEGPLTHREADMVSV